MFSVRKNQTGNSSRRPRPLWQVICAHVLALGVALLAYALPHHVIPRQGQSLGLRSVRGGAVETAEATPTPAADAAQQAMAAASAAGLTAQPTLQPTVQPTEAPAVEGDFRARWAEMFTSGEVEVTDSTYRSANLSIELTEMRYADSVCHIADIYIADIECLATAFARDQYGTAYTEDPADIAARWGSIVSLTGDYYGAHDGGVVIRNGELYRDDPNANDVCVLYWDGTMRTFSPGDFDAETELANGAYQAWCFGPMLLDASGQAMTSFNSNVNPKNPRAAIGYYEPGHYCFVMVEGRTDESEGASLAELSELMASLGCAAAYNLDGGQTAALLAGTSALGGVESRPVSDIIMILDRSAGE